MNEKKTVTISALARTAVSVIRSPARFFREMPKRQGFTKPFAFMVLMGAINGIVIGALGLVDMASNPIFSTGIAIMSVVLYPFIQLSPIAIMSTGMAIAAMVVCPLTYAVFGFAGAGVVHAIWRVLGSREPFETSYCCVAYLSVFMPITTLILAVPYGGLFVSVILVTYLYILISKEVHGISAGKAWVTFGLLGVILFVMGIGADIRTQELRRKTAGLNTTMSSAVPDQR